MTTPNLPVPGDDRPAGGVQRKAHKVGRAPNVGGGSDRLLSADARHNGLDTRTPLDALPADHSAEWSKARAALEKAADALDEFDGEHDALLSESWRKQAEAQEDRYIAAIQSGSKPPARPKGGYVADTEDKRPGVVGEWNRLRREKDRADRAAWEILVREAPAAIPAAQAEIVSAGEAFIAAQEAAERAREAFIAAFGARVSLENYARGGFGPADGGGLPENVVTVGGESIYAASVIVSNAVKWLTANFGDADTEPRYPAKRRMRGPNGAEFDLEPGLALQMERSGMVAVDGFPPESEIHGRRRGGRANVSDRVTAADSTKFRDR